MTETRDEIDLVGLIKKVWLKRLLVVKVCSLFFALGVIISLLSPEVFRSNTVFVPQTDNESMAGGVSGLASLAGISLGSQANGSEIPPTLYPLIVKSVPFKRQVLGLKLQTSPGIEVTLKEFMLNEPENTLSLIKKYTIGLPKVILGSLKSNDEGEVSRPHDSTSLVSISEDERSLFIALDSYIDININQADGVVDLSVTFSDPYVAAQITRETLRLLQNRIIDFKIKSASEKLAFTERQFEAKKVELEAIQDELADFRDKNQKLTSNSMKTQLDRINSIYSVTNTVYQELAIQVERARIQVNEDTPFFTIIEPASIPRMRFKPKRATLVIIWTILGGIVGILTVLFTEPLRKVKRDILA